MITKQASTVGKMRPSPVPTDLNPVCFIDAVTLKIDLNVCMHLQHPMPTTSIGSRLGPCDPFNRCQTHSQLCLTAPLPPGPPLPWPPLLDFAPVFPSKRQGISL
jgi:hypothetical protein